MLNKFIEINSLTVAEAAKQYALQGYPIIPLHTINLDGVCSCGKQDCTHQGKHPRTKRGLKDATTDLKQIEKWWRDMPDSNIGLITGKISNTVVIDIDKDKQGYESLEYFENKFGELPNTLKSKTGGGGLHLVFSYPQIPVKNAIGVLKGIDIRGDEAYIVAPPSIHLSGNKYQWAAD